MCVCGGGGDVGLTGFRASLEIRGNLENGFPFVQSGNTQGIRGKRQKSGETQGIRQ